VADDDALATLIVGLAELRGEVEQLRGVRDQLTEVAASVAQVRGQLEDLASNAAATRPRVVWWPDLDKEEAAVAWSALTKWIGNVLLQRYPEASRVLYPCWQEHPGAVDALTALHATWRAAYQDAAAPPTDAATWLDRWLPTLLGQIRTGLRSCERGNHTSEQGSRAADGTLPTSPRV
jgi:hypothetical protein